MRCCGAVHDGDSYNYEKDYLRAAYGHYGYKDDEPEEEPSPKHNRHYTKHEGAWV